MNWYISCDQPPPLIRGGTFAWYCTQQLASHTLTQPSIESYMLFLFHIFYDSYSTLKNDIAIFLCPFLGSFSTDKLLQMTSYAPQ